MLFNRASLSLFVLANMVGAESDDDLVGGPRGKEFISELVAGLAKLGVAGLWTADFLWLECLELELELELNPEKTLFEFDVAVRDTVRLVTLVLSDEDVLDTRWPVAEVKVSV